jgi:hypothetical protein
MRAYIRLLGREVSGIADLHVITDLSLTAPDELPPHRLRALADEHEAQLEQALPGVEAFAFTVADLLRVWPGVAWPVPGDPGFRDKSAYDRPTQGWLDYVHRAVRKHGNLTRSLPGSAEGRVSNLVSSYPNPNPHPSPSLDPSPSLCPRRNQASYYTHEPSLCLWARRRARRPYVWVLEEDAPFVGSLRVPISHYAASSQADLVAVFMPHASIAATWPA